MSPHPEDLVFRSRIDALLVGLIAAPLLFVVGLVVWRTLRGANRRRPRW